MSAGNMLQSLFGVKTMWQPTENLKTSEGANRIISFSIKKFQTAFSKDKNF